MTANPQTGISAQRKKTKKILRANLLVKIFKLKFMLQTF